MEKYIKYKYGTCRIKRILVTLVGTVLCQENNYYIKILKILKLKTLGVFI